MHNIDLSGSNGSSEAVDDVVKATSRYGIAADLIIQPLCKLREISGVDGRCRHSIQSVLDVCKDSFERSTSLPALDYTKIVSGKISGIAKT